MAHNVMTAGESDGVRHVRPVWCAIRDIAGRCRRKTLEWRLPEHVDRSWPVDSIQRRIRWQV